MRAICDRRATEIVNLAFQMKDFATHRAAHRQNADPNIVAILETKVNELLPRQAASHILDGKSPVGGDIKETIARCHYAKPMISAFLSSGKKMVGRDGFFTGAEALAVLEGRISVSSVVEARARGLEDSDVDPANEDANIVSERRLSAGSAGRVYELKRSDGTCVVFKREAGLARKGALYNGFAGSVSKNMPTKNLKV